MLRPVTDGVTTGGVAGVVGGAVGAFGFTTDFERSQSAPPSAAIRTTVSRCGFITCCKIRTEPTPCHRVFPGKAAVLRKGAVVQIRFGPFILDLGTRQLTRAVGEVHLSPKAFELLSALALERPNALSKEVLQQRLWPATFVAEANLSNLVAE